MLQSQLKIFNIERRTRIVEISQKMFLQKASFTWYYKWFKLSDDERIAYNIMQKIDNGASGPEIELYLKRKVKP